MKRPGSRGERKDIKMSPTIYTVIFFQVFADVLTAVRQSNEGKAILKGWETKIIVSEFWGKIDVEDLPRRKMALVSTQHFLFGLPHQ